MEAAHSRGIQQIWDICHFGYPADINPLDAAFPNRFAAVCAAFAKVFHALNPTIPLIVTPINEVSFLSWLGGEGGHTSPYQNGQGWRLKYMLMKAYIEGIEAIKNFLPDTRILTTEPLVNFTHRIGADHVEKFKAASRNEEQFQVTEMLGGHLCPELRGCPEYLDLLGYNFYYNNQWANEPHETLDWKNPDDRWVPLHQLLQNAHGRYNRPLVLSETSHPKEDRPLWIEMIGNECLAALNAEIPLQGVCWYPIIDRPDWDHLDDWHHSGIWDRTAEGTDDYVRTLHQPTAEAFQTAQSLLGKFSL